MRIPTFSRRSDHDTVHDGSPAGTASTTATDAVAARRHDEAPTLTDGRAVPARTPDRGARRWMAADRQDADRHDADAAAPTSPPPRARTSLLATLGLIVGVAAALLVLSGPLLGYGIAVAGLGAVVSLLGLRATRRRHVAGKADALIGTVLSLAAVTVGLLALTGAVSWLGTDVSSAETVRDWLDARTINRF